MRIVCPSCGVAYQVPAALLAKRQTLKCSACGVKWRVQLPAEEDDSTPVVEAFKASSAHPTPQPEVPPTVEGSAGSAGDSSSTDHSEEASEHQAHDVPAVPPQEKEAQDVAESTISSLPSEAGHSTPEPEPEAHSAQVSDVGQPKHPDVVSAPQEVDASGVEPDAAEADVSSETVEPPTQQGIVDGGSASTIEPPQIPTQPDAPVDFSSQPSGLNEGTGTSSEDAAQVASAWPERLHMQSRSTQVSSDQLKEAFWGVPEIPAYSATVEKTEAESQPEIAGATVSTPENEQPPVTAAPIAASADQPAGNVGAVATSLPNNTAQPEGYTPVSQSPSASQRSSVLSSGGALSNLLLQDVFWRRAWIVSGVVAD